MEAKDLRIGNLALFRTGVLKITSSDLDALEEGSNNYKPLPLNDEWLIKLGWIWNEETNSFEKFPDGDARMHLDKTSFGYTMFNYVLKAVIAKKIYYVHQLQNLYFALTGEELTIKELA